MVLPESDKSFDFSGDGYPFGMGKDFPYLGVGRAVGAALAAIAKPFGTEAPPTICCVTVSQEKKWH